MVPADARRGSRLAVAATAVAVVAWVGANAVWLVQHREGQPLNIDEAGYLGISLNDSYSWERAGLSGWVDAVFTPSLQAPLTTATTSLVQLGGWSHLSVAFGVVLVFAGLTIAATAALAATLGGRTTVLVAVALLLSAPGFVALSRNFVFAVPAAAVTMLALYALRRSRWLTSTGWSAAFGVAVGLMPLARTMMISFAPVLLLLAVVHALGHRAGRRRQGLNAALAGVLAVAVAATWLVPSSHLVFGYLTEYGYGKHSADYSISTGSAPFRVLTAFGQDFFVPHLVLIGIGWLLLLVGRGRRPGDDRSSWTRLQDLVASPLSVCVGLVLGAGLALMTSDNGGVGFALPLLAPAVVAAAAGWARWISTLSASRARRVVVAALAAVCLVLALPSFTDTWLGKPRSVNVLGARLPVTSGQRTDPAYLFTPITAVATDPAVLRNSPAWGPAWNRAGDRLVADVLDDSTARPDFAFGFRNRYVNLNSLQLKVIERLHYGVAIAQLDPTAIGSTRADYRDWLTRGAAAASCHLLLSGGTINEVAPFARTARLSAAAQEAGFRRTDRVGLPDGRTVVVWERTRGSC